jgi:hypothetical protein
VRTELRAELDTRLGSLARSGSLRSKRAPGLFETYVWSILIEAAKAEGATASYGQLGPSGRLLMPQGPRNLFGNQFSFARLDFADYALEAHTNLYVEGRSKVLHECDVALLDAEEAEVWRDRGVHPKASKLILGVECKFHGPPVPLDEARSFLGLTTEIATVNRFMVSNASPERIQKVLVRHRRLWRMPVVPSDSRRVSALQASFEDVFRDYAAIR